MRRIPYFLERLWYTTLCLALVILVAGCDEDTGPSGAQNYTLRWVFVNASPNPNDNREFQGRDNLTNASVRRTVGGNGGATSATTVEPWADIGVITVTVSIDGDPPAQKTLGYVPIFADDTTTITAVWDGAELDVSNSGSGAIWKLDRITGTASGNWSDLASTASGTLSFNAPVTVQEGKQAFVSATFSGSVTALPGWEGIRKSMSVGIQDLNSVPGLNVTNAKQLDRAEPTASGSVDVDGLWTIPTNPATLSIRAGGEMGYNPALNLVATYSKVP